MTNNLAIILETFEKGINTNNCNARLNVLYKKRDDISHAIDLLIPKGINYDSLEVDYNKVCDTIDKLCYYRRTHSGCLLEGDEGYCLY